MSILSRTAVLKLVAADEIAIAPFDPKLLGEDGTYPLSFGTKITWPQSTNQQFRHGIDLRHLSEVQYAHVTIGSDGYELDPGRFVVIQSAERVRLGKAVFGLLSTRRPLAMCGLDVTQASIFIPPGADGLLDLETSNRGSCRVRIFPGVPAVKIVFMSVT